jgi:hypothetical protein
MSFVLIFSNLKSKAVTIQAWTGAEAEVSRRLRLPDFKMVGT